MAAFNSNASELTNLKYVDKFKVGNGLNLYKGIKLSGFNVEESSQPYVIMNSKDDALNVENISKENITYRVTIVNK